MSLFSLPRRFKRRLSFRRSDPKDKNATLSRASMRDSNSAPSAPLESPQPGFMEMPKLDVNYGYGQAASGNDGNRHMNQTLRRTTTLTAGASAPETNFWDINGYQNVVNRLEDGYELGEKLCEMLSQRAKIEETYANSLKKWKKEWEMNLRKKPYEYETAGNTWYSLLETGEDAAALHYEFCEKIVKSPIYKLNQWLKEKYQKQLLNFKLKKDFEKEFDKAQESWKKNIDLLKKSKKDYHEACKKVKQAERNDKNVQLSTKSSGADKLKSDKDLKTKITQSDNAKDEYMRRFKALDSLKGGYQQSMVEVYEKAKLFEQARLEKFKEILGEYNQLLEEHYKDYRFQGIVDRNAEELSHVNPNADIDNWSKQHGPGMEPLWPIFEEYTE